MINRITFKAYCRNAPLGGRLTEQQEEGLDHILDEWNAQGGSDLRQLAYVLATAFHETGGKMAPVREGFAKNDASARKIVRKICAGRPAKTDYSRPDPATGHVYYARGLSQLTWADNYKRLGQKIGVRLYENPDLALEPDISARVLVVGMLAGMFTGKGLDDYFNDTADDPVEARRIINGTDKAQLISTYHEQFLGALKAADTSTPQPQDVTKADAEPDGKPLAQDPLTIGTMTSAAGGIGASLIAAVNNPWALVAVLVIAVGVGLFLTGRLQIRRQAGA